MDPKDWHWCGQMDTATPVKRVTDKINSLYELAMYPADNGPQAGGRCYQAARVPTNESKSWFRRDNSGAIFPPARQRNSYLRTLPVERVESLVLYWRDGTWCHQRVL